MNFDGYELKKYIVNAIKDIHFKEFTDVQKEVFNSFFNGDKNILAKSKTGSGKTHAFLIPIFESLDEKKQEVQATIIAPTKELALQIYKVCNHIASFCGDTINIKLFTGGSDRLKEIEKIKNNMPQIVIGTPGKIKDLAIDENVLKIYTSNILVIDEVDMTFENGFKDELDQITAVCQNAKMMFFSATISENVLPYIKKYMTNVDFKEIKDNNNLKIKHIWIPLKYKERYDVLKDLLSTFQPYLCLIFVNKKETAVSLAGKLQAEGYFVGQIHGDMSPRERKRVLNDATKLKYQFIVATDLAARGIDIPGISHIINYELPYDYEFYVHRSGRTGRMYNDGIVYTLYEDLDNDYLDNLNKKNIQPEYYEIKNKQLVEYKGRNTRKDRIKPKTDYQKEAAKYVPLGEKKPGYKKRRQAMISEIADKLKAKDQKQKKKRKR